MDWLYLLGAFIFPIVFILWRPRLRVSPATMRVRFTASVVAVWLLIILWNTRGTIASGGEDVDVDRMGTTQESTSSWEADAPTDSAVIVLLGWVPGLVYSGLLILARKGLEPPPVEILDTGSDSESMLHR
jgi:hypothetical protein